jgi:hypothetical protein
MVPFDKQVVTVIRQGKAGTDTTDEPPLRVGFGISDKTIGGANAPRGARFWCRGLGPTPRTITPQRRVLALQQKSDRMEVILEAVYVLSGANQD